jgi:hypothetical protein
MASHQRAHRLELRRRRVDVVLAEDVGRTVVAPTNEATFSETPFFSRKRRYSSRLVQVIG